MYKIDWGCDFEVVFVLMWGGRMERGKEDGGERLIAKGERRVVGADLEKSRWLDIQFFSSSQPAGSLDFKLCVQPSRFLLGVPRRAYLFVYIHSIAALCVRYYIS